MAKPIWIKGEGVIDEHGRFYPEQQVRDAVEVINRMVTWIKSLPTETQDILKWEAELSD